MHHNISQTFESLLFHSPPFTTLITLLKNAWIHQINKFIPKYPAEFEKQTLQQIHMITTIQTNVLK